MGKKGLQRGWIFLFILYPFFLPPVVLGDIFRCGRTYCKEITPQGYCKPCSLEDPIKVDLNNCIKIPKSCEDLMPPPDGGDPASSASSTNKAAPLPSGRKKN